MTDDAEARSGRLTGQVAVVAGAGGEIVAAVATRFAGEGATVVGMDRVDGIGRSGVVGRIVERDGRVDVLYNNARPLTRTTTRSRPMPSRPGTPHTPRSSCRLSSLASTWSP